MSFKECNVVLIVRPLAEVIEGSIEETVHNGKQPREVPLVEETADNQEQTYWHIESHFEDKGLYFVAHLCNGVKLFPNVKFPMCFFSLFGFPENNLLSEFDGIHIVEGKIDVGPYEREDIEGDADDSETKPFEHDGHKCSDNTGLYNRP